MRYSITFVAMITYSKELVVLMITSTLDAPAGKVGMLTVLLVLYRCCLISLLPQPNTVSVVTIRMSEVLVAAGGMYTQCNSL